jgi:hypothetical protein
MMTSLIVFMVFFGILVLLYPIVILVSSVSLWVLEKCAVERHGRALAQKMDDVKDVVFVVMTVLIFFIVSPLAVFFLLDLI